MGLDMYLTKKIYIGAYYEHKDVTGSIDIKMGGKPVAINFSKVEEIIERAMYWRKANQIHHWFVENVQDGEDECDEHYVSYEQLMELKDLCQKVIDTKDGSLLPPAEGFFFGGTEIDDYYFGELARTVEGLKDIDPDASYYYHSSW